MADYKLISADSHIVEPPDMYTGRIEPRFRDRAPKMERRKTPAGREYDAWMLGGMQVGTLGAVMQAGQRFEDPSQIDFLGLWEDVRKGAYDADAMIVENEEDGIWGSVLQPSQGLFWYRIPESDLLTEICRVYNDWIADFCKPHPRRLKGIDISMSTTPMPPPKSSSAASRWALSAPSSRSRRARISPTAVPFTTISGRRRRTSITRS